MTMTTRISLSSVIVIREALREAVAAWPADGGTPYAPMKADLMDDLLADLIDFHTPNLSLPPKLKKPRKK